MEGVTTAILAFLLVCIVFPTIVKNKPSYYGAFAAVVLVILLSGLAAVIQTRAFLAVSTFMIALLQIGALILLMLAAGGLTLRQLAGEVNEAIDAVRQSDSQKPADPVNAGVSAPPQPPGTGPPNQPRVILDSSASSAPRE